jgi:hypothetical protein
MDDPIEKPPETGMERIAALEQRVKVLEKAMAVSFGVVWMEQIQEQMKAEDGG